MPGGPTQIRTELHPDQILSPWSPRERRERAPTAPTIFGQKGRCGGGAFGEYVGTNCQRSAMPGGPRMSAVRQGVRVRVGGFVGASGLG
eukprot:15483040-Alexandrium_andersonii.AAC.1